MPNILDLAKSPGPLGPASNTPLADESAPLPAELDTRILERTAQLQKQNEELEAFSWSVSHDLTAPLVQIHAYLRFLKRHPGAKLDEVADGYLAGIQTCAERMSCLTQNLLRLARIDRTELQSSRVDLT